MGARAKALLVNGLVLTVAVVLTVLVLELCFALFVEVTDNVDYEHLPAVGLRLKPGQSGTYIRAGVDGGEAIKARFHVNKAGFNHRRDYQEARPAERYRIAVVGDSFVEAFQVDYEDSFFRRLEAQLRASGLDAEVYAFGISGNGTSQAYHMIDEYVLSYRPNLVVYLFIPNDLADSSPFQGRSSWTRQYDLDERGELVALPFSRYRLSAAKALLKRSRLLRFICYQHRLLARLKTLRAAPRDRRTGAVPGSDPAGTAGAAEQRAWTIVERLLEKMDQRLHAADVPWLLMWQGDADPTFHTDKRDRLAAIAERHGIWFFDPSRDFAAAQAREGESYRIHGDGHWNRHGHRVVGNALARVVLAALEPPSGEATFEDHGPATSQARPDRAGDRAGRGPSRMPR